MNNLPAAVGDMNASIDSRARVREERELSRVPSETMTAGQAERILQLWQMEATATLESPFPTRRSTILEALGFADIEPVVSVRQQHLDRALINIPTRHMTTWSSSHMWNHYGFHVKYLQWGRDFMERAQTAFAAQRDRLADNPELRATVQSALVVLEGRGMEDADRRQEMYTLARLTSQQEREGFRFPAVDAFLQHIPLYSVPEDDRTCSICKMEYPKEATSAANEVDSPVQLPCNHIYGHICVTAWLREVDTCPLCRRNYRFELNGHREVTGIVEQMYDDGGFDADEGGDDDFGFDPNADPNAIVFFVGDDDNADPFIGNLENR